MAKFLSDVKTLRENARKNLRKGSITDAYGADLPRVLEVLNQSTERVEVGIRIEDLVVVTDDGIRILTQIPKPLRIVG